MRDWRLILRFLIGLPAFLLGANCAAISLLGHLAVFRGLGPIPDIPNHFAPFWLAGALVAVLIGLAYPPPWRRWICGAGLVGMIASAALILPEYVRDTGPKAPADAPGQIKVIQFNAWFANPDEKTMVDWLKAEDPDFVVMQETNAYLRGELVKDGRWHVVCPNCDEIIVSKLKPLPADPHPVPNRPGVLIPEPIVRARVQDARGTFTVIGIHNGWPLSFMQRWQEQRLSRVIGEDADRSRTIVMGDFNSAPWSYHRRHWDKAFGLIRRDRAIFTWPGRPSKGLPLLQPFLPIDHIYAGEDWATVKVYRGPRLTSDHYPVVAILAPRARP